MYGTLARPSPRTDFGPTQGQRLANPTLTEASRALAKEREALNYRSPCQDNPQMWDGTDEDEDREDALTRVLVAGALCAYCNVFTQCEKVKESVLTNPDGVTAGMFAGDYVPASPEDYDIRHYLEKGEWPDHDER